MVVIVLKFSMFINQNKKIEKNKKKSKHLTVIKALYNNKSLQCVYRYLYLA